MSKYLLLFLPVIFSSLAQVLIKYAALKEMKTLQWYISMMGSIVAYFLAFALYSIAVRYFPISVASPVNTIAVMLVVVLVGIFFWGEPFAMRQWYGVGLGIFSLFLLLSGK